MCVIHVPVVMKLHGVLVAMIIRYVCMLFSVFWCQLL